MSKVFKFRAVFPTSCIDLPQGVSMCVCSLLLLSADKLGMRDDASRVMTASTTALFD